ncbi:MAG: hypothetical protein ACE15D_12600 [Candidatus Eisenbacteria bacterium]
MRRSFPATVRLAPRRAGFLLRRRALAIPLAVALAVTAPAAVAATSAAAPDRPGSVAPSPATHSLPDGQHLSGRVVDGSGRPLAGTQARLFVGGLPVSAAVSDTTGSFRLDFALSYGKDETAVVFWMPAHADLVPEIALLRESSADLAAGIWSPCVPRLGGGTTEGLTVRILDRLAFRRWIAERGCTSPGAPRVSGFPANSGAEEPAKGTEP